MKNKNKEEIEKTCDICGMRYNKEMYKVDKKLFNNELPCSCNIIKEVIELKKKIKLLKRVDEYNELNNIRCVQKLADENLSKCLREQTDENTH